MTNLLNKIEMLIEEKAEKEGIVFPSNESVTVELELTNEQLEQFYNLDLTDNYDYEIEDNKVIITYTDIDEVFNQLSELQGKQMTLCELSNDLQWIVDYDFLNFISESIILEYNNVGVSKNDIEYNIMFEVVELNEEKLIDTVIEITEIEYN